MTLDTPLVWTPLLPLALCITLDAPQSQAATPPTTRYVPDDGGDGTGDCSDSQNPCETVRYALGRVSAGDTVRVANKFSPATYFGPITITQPIALAGGWNATSTPSWLLWQRPSPCEASRTTIDAQGTGRAVSIANHVDARVDCFTVTGWDATGQGGSGISYDVGGGICGCYGDTVVSNCIITGNVASRATIG